MVHDTECSKSTKLGALSIYSEVMKTTQCTHPCRHHTGFVTKCRVWATSGAVCAFLVLDPLEFSRSTKQEASIHQLKQKLVHGTETAQQTQS